MSLRAGHNR